MAEDDSDEVPKLPPDARLESLDERIDRMQQEEVKRTRKTAARYELSGRPAGVQSARRLSLGGRNRRLAARPLAGHQALADAGAAVPRLRGRRLERHSDFKQGLERGSGRTGIEEASVAAEGKIDPMHQFVIEPIAGSFGHNNPFVFTNSALWTLIVLGTIWIFMFGGMKRELIPGRWQVAVEGLIALRRRHGERQHRARGQEVSAVGVHRVRLPAVREPDRQHAVWDRLCRSSVHDHRPVHFHRRHVADHLRDRARCRLLEARAPLLLAVRSEGRSARLQVL